jgi:hypothetical protein
VSSFAIEVWDDEAEKVTFYSVRWEDGQYSEMERFLSRIDAIPEMKQPLQELIHLILEVIGNTHGAQEAFFNRFENRVTALPPKGNIKISELELDYRGFPLRLYCLALSEEIVILFNGGIKDSQTVQESKDVITAKFYEANEFAKRILTALNAEEILVEGRQLKNYNDGTEIYL